MISSLQVYKKSQRNKKSIHKAVTQAAKSFDLYTENPRMVPRQLTPSVLKMEMTVGKFQAQRYVQLFSSLQKPVMWSDDQSSNC